MSQICVLPNWLAVLAGVAMLGMIALLGVGIWAIVREERIGR